MAEPEKPNESPKPGEEKQKKFDVNLEDLKDEVGKSLYIRVEDLPVDDEINAARGVFSRPGQGKHVQIIYCTECGKGSQAGSSYCSNCGASITSMQPPIYASRSAEGRSAGKRLIKVLLITALILLVFAGGIYLYLMLFGNEDKEIVMVSVPGDYSSVQAAINAAEDGWEIVVAPGNYRENIDFLGKNIVLRSEDPEDSVIVAKTILDGRRSGPVVNFSSGENNQAVLKGFTIRNGSGLLELVKAGDDNREELIGLIGGGIVVLNNSAPLIEKNIIEDNISDLGGGIAVYRALPKITKNTITANTATNYVAGYLYLSHRIH